MAATTQPRHRLLEGVELPDRYRVIRRIATGGMATVWCAEDQMLGRRVALKLLADRFAHDPGAIRRFLREARTAARLSGHPNIVTIFDVGQTVPGDEEQPRPFIVMEHLPCGTVADALRVGEVRPDDPVQWIRDAAAALDFAHDHDVVHRDIKPANLLIDRTRRLHVGDFGIARIAAEDTITHGGQLFGTAAYLAPEQARGEPATQASDRYALAVVAFELLTGTRPFLSRNFAMQARQHLEEPAPAASSRRRSLPPALDAVLDRGLAKAPADRWASASEFADALQRAMTARPSRRRVLASPPPPPARLTAAAPRSPGGPPRPRLIAVGALAATAFVIGVAAGANHHHRATPAKDLASRHAVAGNVQAGAASPARRRQNNRRPAAAHRAPATTGAVSAAATSSATTRQAPPAGPATALEARGHSLLAGGDPAGAIPVLRQALASSSPATLTYAYALYDLGRALRLAGDPAAAVPILRRRLEIPNQTAVVRAELQRAIAATRPVPPPRPSGGATIAAPARDGRGRGPDGHGPPGQLKRQRPGGGD